MSKTNLYCSEIGVLPLSRSVSWSEIDMIADDEQFIKIEDIQKVHQPYVDKKTGETPVLNKSEIRLVDLFKF